jgi:hypothetical protein
VKLILGLGAAMWALGASSCLAQAPQRSEARGGVEEAAYDKAKCVYDAINIAGRVFFPKGKAPDQLGKTTDDIMETINNFPRSTPEEATAQLDTFASKAKEGVRACLTEREVYDLGRFSFLEDMVLTDGSACPAQKAPAAAFDRTPNNGVGEIAEASVRWDIITDDASISAHPFFKGQREARGFFRGRDKSDLCAAILSEYGPRGTRIPGLVRSGKKGW